MYLQLSSSCSLLAHCICLVQWCCNWLPATHPSKALLVRLVALADTWCVQKGTVGNPVVHPEWHAAACAQLPPLNSVSYIQPEYSRQGFSTPGFRVLGFTLNPKPQHHSYMPSGSRPEWQCVLVLQHSSGVLVWALGAQGMQRQHPGDFGGVAGIYIAL